MRGQDYGSEHIHHTDPRSGVSILQLTSYPRISWNMYFEHNHFTPDCKTVIIRRQRELKPGAAADVYRCDVDGRNMIQLTDEDGIYGIALSRDGRYVYYLKDTTLKRVSMDTFELAEILHVSNAQPGGVGMAGQTGDGRCLFCTMRVGEETGLFRLAADGSGAELLLACERIGHVSCDPGNVAKPSREALPSRCGRQRLPRGTATPAEGLGDVVSFFGIINGKYRFWVIDGAGGEPLAGQAREFPMQRFAHCSWLGRTGRVQGCLLPPGRAIMSMAEGDSQPEPIVGGPYFWHSGASLDGEWIVADTNWPDEGLMLAHVPTRSFTFLCDSHSGNDDAPFSHPEPAISPDGSVVIYTSTRTGIAQVYIALVPEEMREALGHSLDWQGTPDDPRPHYMPKHGWGRV